MSSEQSATERVFQEFLREKWWRPLYAQMCIDGSGQPMHSTLAFYLRERDEWERRFAEAQAKDRLHKAQEALGPPTTSLGVRRDDASA